MTEFKLDIIFIIGSRYLLLGADIYYWEQIFIIGSRYLLLGADIYYWEQIFLSK
jgi:hypothetical protein